MYSFIYGYFIGIIVFFSQMDDVNLLKLRSHVIINGIPATEGQFPFVVAIRFKYRHVCGGTIITSSWILTAAHCVSRSKVSKMTVVYGTVHTYNGVPMRGNEMEVEKIIKHERYSRKTFYQNDISVLKLIAELTWSHLVQPINLIHYQAIINEGTPANVTGWGRNADALSFYLQYSQLQTFGELYCNEKHRGLINDFVEICVGIENSGRNTCDGDSGGPLIINGYQAGISSWVQAGKSCSSGENPGVYTRLSAYIDWITYVTGIIFINN